MARYKTKAMRSKRKPLSPAQYKAVARLANRQINKKAECKFVDQDHGNLNAQSTAVVTKINPPAQGDGVSSRDGDSLFLKSLQVRAHCNPNAAAAVGLRMLIIQWLEDDADATPVVGDILSNTSSGNDLMQSFYNINSKKRFRVLKDFRVFVDPNNSGGDNKMINFKSKKIPLRKLTLNAAAITGVGNFFLITCGNAAATTTFASVLTRLRYYDN